MRLWGTKIENWDHFFTPTSTQNGGIFVLWVCHFWVGFKQTLKFCSFLAVFGSFFLWARTQKLKCKARGRFWSMRLNPNIFGLLWGSITTMYVPTQGQVDTISDDFHVHISNVQDSHIISLLINTQKHDPGSKDFLSYEMLQIVWFGHDARSHVEICPLQCWTPPPKEYDNDYFQKK